MVPFYIYYSMFGYQRVGDLVWAAADSRARGFMLGGTAGRTTLNGEGLQHEDGHSHLLFSVVPNCRAYDPTFGYEVAVIIQDGLRRMFAEHEDVFYYLTLLNENYPHPPMPDGAEDGILRGMYLLREGPQAQRKKVRACSCSAPARSCARCSPPPSCSTSDFGVVADVWSVTSFTELRRDGIEVERWNMLHPLEPPRRAYVTECLQHARGPSSPRPTICARSRTRSADGCPARYRVLGTDGFGRSDYRRALRRFFEVDRHYVAVAALTELAGQRRDRGRARDGGDRALPDRSRSADPDLGVSPRSPAVRRRGTGQVEPGKRPSLDDAMG